MDKILIVPSFFLLLYNVLPPFWVRCADVKMKKQRPTHPLTNFDPKFLDPYIYWRSTNACSQNLRNVCKMYVKFANIFSNLGDWKEMWAIHLPKLGLKSEHSFTREVNGTHFCGISPIPQCLTLTMWGHWFYILSKIMFAFPHFWNLNGYFTN